MRTLPFHHVDVFTERPLLGNPLAVYLDADELDAAVMQQIAREMNLSETTFVQRSTAADCAFRVRIFTPGQELPFAGHPTVGTAFVLHRLKLLPDAQFAFQMNVGPVRVRREAGMFWISPPSPKGERLDDPAALAAALGIQARSCLGACVVRNGVQFLCTLLASSRDVDSVQPNRQELAKLGEGFATLDILVFSYEAGRGYSRMFPDPAYGIVEDPATGGSMAPLCLTLKLCGRLDAGTSEISIEQGTKIGRQSLLHARFSQLPDSLRDIEVGGSAVHLFESALTV